METTIKQSTETTFETVSVGSFLKANGLVNYVPVIRLNTNDKPYVTFISNKIDEETKKPKAMNIYFCKYKGEV
jgi:hypothetical protein